MAGSDGFQTAQQLAATVWRRHWRIITATSVAVGGLVLLAFAPAAVALGIQQYSEQSGDISGRGYPPLGTQVRDAQVVFVVHQIRCGAAEQTTQGRLCEVTIGARNGGPEPVTVPGGMQRLAGPEGLRHAPVPGEPAPFGTIAPGAAATAVLSYDVPPQADITHIVVRAGPYTEGQPVALDGRPLPLPDTGGDRATDGPGPGD